MVRFHWHVEDGLAASVQPGQLTYMRDAGVLQAMVEIELGSQGGVMDACLHIPPNYTTDGGVKELGVVIAHGDDVSDWRGRLILDLAIHLARAGFFVMRFIAPHPSTPEPRRVALYEKAVDVAATCPYARAVNRWVLAGLGSGARVAALAAPRVRSLVAGYVFMSYPLREALHTVDAAGQPLSGPDSSGPLLGLGAPSLYVCGAADPLVGEHALAELAGAGRLGSRDVRVLVLPDTDHHFRMLNGKGPMPGTIRLVLHGVLEFLNAAAVQRMDLCKLPHLPTHPPLPGTEMVGLWDGGPEAAAAAGRPSLPRPACFRPLPASGQPQPLSPEAAAAAEHEYGTSAAAQMQAHLAVQIQAQQAQQVLQQQQQAAMHQQRMAAAAAAGMHHAPAAAHQQQAQHAHAHQQHHQHQHHQQAAGSGGQYRRADAAAAAAAAEAGPGSAGAKAPRGMPVAAVVNPQMAALTQALADPATAAQIAAVLMRNTQMAAAHGQGAPEDGAKGVAGVPGMPGQAPLSAAGASGVLGGHGEVQQQQQQQQHPQPEMYGQMTGQEGAAAGDLHMADAAGGGEV
ncbi:hypothetical protein HYH02_008214 [Chlamydomonas schloesseri]|uniref:Uncharacterized protein n=1 Tax=Chlamydomonas schloesseri TaxID=2026947 RepID=A0A835WFT8_9CHLO|nr:hypothetical protein HYH02_008214 [Chlamydomonas schloesseri]|eukprot:KAG2446642.1 hypothetical protein HYH02_008214 [Chlamydomonas schloesseri]